MRECVHVWQVWNQLVLLLICSCLSFLWFSVFLRELICLNLWTIFYKRYWLLLWKFFLYSLTLFCTKQRSNDGLVLVNMERTVAQLASWLLLSYYLSILAFPPPTPTFFYLLIHFLSLLDNPDMTVWLTGFIRSLF